MYRPGSLQCTLFKNPAGEGKVEGGGTTTDGGHMTEIIVFHIGCRCKVKAWETVGFCKEDELAQVF